MNRKLFFAMDYVNIVPGRETPGDFSVRFFVSGAQICEGLSGKHDAPAKRVVRSVAFVNGNLMGGIGLFHEDGEIHSGRPAADDVDFHLEVGQAFLPVQLGSIAGTDRDVALFFQQLTGDDQFLNFRSAFVNSECANISIKAFNHAASHQSGAAMNLQ